MTNTTISPSDFSTCNNFNYTHAGTSGLSAPAANMLSGVLDELAYGIIIVDQKAQVFHTNIAAQALLALADCICIQNDILVTTDPADAQNLQHALAKAAVGKRSMVALNPLARVTVTVVPLKTAASEAPRFALMFSRAGVCESLMLSFFSRAHKLTSSEEKILGLLCIGLTAPEMAQRLMVGEATVRTHVRNICTKTQSSGIREVVKRLAVLPPLMAAVMPGGMITV